LGGYQLFQATKCQKMRFFFADVEFAVSGAGIRITEEKIQAITNWPMVRSPKDVRSFLGLAGLYRKFAPDFALAAMPLFQLRNINQREFDIYMDSTQPTQPAKPTLKPTVQPTVQPTQPTLTTGRQLVPEAIARLKQIITMHPALALPQRGNDDFMVRTDASDYALGVHSARCRQGRRRY
jgi:hypothetical protein